MSKLISQCHNPIIYMVLIKTSVSVLVSVTESHQLVPGSIPSSDVSFFTFKSYIFYRYCILSITHINGN